MPRSRERNRGAVPDAADERRGSACDVRVGGRVQFFAALYEDFRAFPDHLATGGVWPRSEHDPWLLEALKNTTKPDSGVWTEVVLPQAPAALVSLEQGGRLLDIGAGAGVALIHYAKRFPAAEIVGVAFDEPSYLLAREAVADAGNGDRVEVRHDANQLTDVDTYDVVTMSITLHETGGPEEYRNVLARVRRALKPGGTLLVAELPYPDSPEAYRTEPAYRMLASSVLLHFFYTAAWSCVVQRGTDRGHHMRETPAQRY